MGIREQVQARARSSALATLRNIARATSLCDSRQIAALVVSRYGVDGFIGVNGHPEHDVNGARCSEWCPRMKAGRRDDDYSDDPAIHAEIRALLRAGERARGGEMVTTAPPCADCCYAISRVRVRSVVWPVPTNEREMRASWAAETYLRGVFIDVAVVDMEGNEIR